MRILLLVFALISALHADPVDYTYTTGAQYTEYANQNGAFILYVPEFNPNLGTLDSITYSFTDAMTGLGGYNDMGVLDGTTFTYTWIGSDTSNLFTASASDSMPVVVSGSGINTSGGGFESALSLVASGTVTGSAMRQFIGG